MTSKEFARLIGVSQSTVSRALNGEGNVAVETREYVLEKAREYNFVMNSVARSLKTNRTRTIGILFPAYFDSLSKNLMFTHLYDNLQKELLKHNYDTMVIANAGEGTALERIVRSRKIDGIINFRSSLTEQDTALIEQSQLAFMFLHSGQKNNDRFHQILLDEYDAGRCVGEYFAQFPRRACYYLGRADRETMREDRFLGYRDALKKAGISLEREQILACPFSMEAAGRAMEEVDQAAQHGPINLFVYNDMMCIGAVHALLLRGIRIPDQVQVFGMDNIPQASWLSPPLSTMAVPTAQMVEEGCRLILQLIEGEAPPVETRLMRAYPVFRSTTLRQA